MPPPVQDLSVIGRWAAQYPGEPLMVWTSGGKDSFCCLALACEALGPDRVVPVYRYLVEGLRCIETPIRAQLHMLGIKRQLVSVPGADTLEMLRSATFTPAQALGKERAPRKVKFADVERLARKRSGCVWTASGEKAVDTAMRRLWLRPYNGIDKTGRHLYPVHLWGQSQVRAFCALRRAPLAPNFGAEVTSGLGFHVLDEVQARYPDDYARILKAFPYAEAIQQRDRIYGKRPRSLKELRKLAHQVSDGRSSTPPPLGDPAGDVQPPASE